MAEIVDSLRLVKQKKRLRRILNLQRDITYLDKQLQGPSGMRITDMPKSQKPTNKEQQIIQRIMEKEKQLTALKKDFSTEDVILRKVIKKFDDLAETSATEDTILQLQDILIYHYLQDWSMKEIYKIFAGSGKFKEDSDEDSNMRNLYKKHAKAIDMFEKCQLGECVGV